MTTTSPRPLQVPLLIHVVNVVALLVLGVIVLLAGVVSVKSFLLLVPILGLLLVYWRFRRSLNVAAVYLGISLSVIGWIVLCENIVRIDNLTGLGLTDRLTLGLRLRTYVDEHLTREGRNYRQPCCHDPLVWNYQPGSTHQWTYDCPTCNQPYRFVVDDTGFLNRPVGLLADSQRIDMFIAGDSVLQGLGVPSFVELIRDQMPVTMWNLSISGYGPRQKISAILAYALDKRPQWLVVEFYARNDVSDAVSAEICRETEDFRCLHSPSEIPYRLMHHPIYREHVNESPDLFRTFQYYASQNLTLEVTRVTIETLRSALKYGVMAGIYGHSPADDEDGAQDVMRTTAIQDQHKPVFLASPTNTRIDHHTWLAWVSVGMAQVHAEYRRLAEALAPMPHKPTVVLLYNPTPYELYRDLTSARNPAYDEAAAFQREAQRAFAAEHGWVFLDPSEPLRQAIQEGSLWLYGRFDPSHWSLDGTKVAAQVLKTELLRVMGKHDVSRSAP
jgi:hypothetical protein